jgi:hypothetical protein
LAYTPQECFSLLIQVTRYFSLALCRPSPLEGGRPRSLRHDFFVSTSFSSLPIASRSKRGKGDTRVTATAIEERTDSRKMQLRPSSSSRVRFRFDLFCFIALWRIALPSGPSASVRGHPYQPSQTYRLLPPSSPPPSKRMMDQQTLLSPSPPPMRPRRNARSVPRVSEGKLSKVHVSA